MPGKLIKHDTAALTIAEPGRLDRNPAAVYIASLSSPRSRDTMQQALNRIADVLMPGQFERPLRTAPEVERRAYKTRCLTVTWGALRFEHAAAVRARLAETDKPATVNKILSALRGVLLTAYQLGQMGADDYQRARMVKSVKGETVPSGRELGDGEILALVNVCKADTTAAGARDAALIGLLYAGGLRRAELVALDIADFDMESGQLVVRHGKGRKERTLYIDNGALAAMQAWFVRRGKEAGALFQPVNKAGKITPSHMTAQAIYNMLKKRADQAQVKSFSPHDFRRTLAGILIERADIVTAQRILGHASVTTTGRYDRRPEEVKRKAAKLVHFPF